MVSSLPCAACAWVAVVIVVVDVRRGRGSGEGAYSRKCKVVMVSPVPLPQAIPHSSTPWYYAMAISGFNDFYGHVEFRGTPGHTRARIRVLPAGYVSDADNAYAPCRRWRVPHSPPLPALE